MLVNYKSTVYVSRRVINLWIPWFFLQASWNQFCTEIGPPCECISFLRLLDRCYSSKKVWKRTRFKGSYTV